MDYVNLAKTALTNSLQHIVLFVTSRCNARCSFCFYWREIEEKQKNELTLEEIQKIAMKVKPFGFLSLTGGEPFLRTDLPDIVAAFSDKIQGVHIPTNASLPHLIEKNFERMVRENPNVFFRLSMSLDAVGEKHSKMRVIEKNFELLLDSYDRVKGLKKDYKNCELAVITTFSAFNQNDIRTVVDFVANLDAVDSHTINFIRGQPKDPTSKNVDVNLYEDALKYLEEVRKSRERLNKGLHVKFLHSLKYYARDVVLQTVKENKMILPCTAGRKLVIIQDNGDVFPCEVLDKSFKLGSLRESNYDLHAILDSERTKSITKWIVDTKCFCTFECAIQNNIVANPKVWPKVIANAVKMK